MELRSDEALQELRAERVGFRGQNYTAITLTQMLELLWKVSLHNRRSLASVRLPQALIAEIHKIKPLPVRRRVVVVVKGPKLLCRCR